MALFSICNLLLLAGGKVQLQEFVGNLQNCWAGNTASKTWWCSVSHEHRACLYKEPCYSWKGASQPRQGMCKAPRKSVLGKTWLPWSHVQQGQGSVLLSPSQSVILLPKGCKPSPPSLRNAIPPAGWVFRLWTPDSCNPQRVPCLPSPWLPPAAPTPARTGPGMHMVVWRHHTTFFQKQITKNSYISNCSLLIRLD